jgi:hypothetical protein
MGSYCLFPDDINIWYTHAWMLMKVEYNKCKNENNLRITLLLVIAIFTFFCSIYWIFRYTFFSNDFISKKTVLFYFI